MTIRRLVLVFALPLAVVFVASDAHAGQAKDTTKPVGMGLRKVDSPTMAKSIKDWHPELAAGARRTASATTCACSCPCGAANTQTAANMAPAGQQGNRGERSGRAFERAREVPLSSLRP